MNQNKLITIGRMGGGVFYVIGRYRADAEIEYWQAPGEWVPYPANASQCAEPEPLLEQFSQFGGVIGEVADLSAMMTNPELADGCVPTKEHLLSRAFIESEAAKLIALAEAHGMVLTIDTVPLKPLGMGRYVMSPSVRAAR